MIEMIRRVLRQKFESVGIIITLAVMALLASAALASSDGQSDGNTLFLVVLVLAARSVSKDAASGALQMILARPIRRSAYLFGRYLGILSAFAMVLTVTFLMSLLLPKLFSGVITVPPDFAATLARKILGELCDGALLVATLLFFSTFLPGFADLLAYFLLVILVSVPEGIGQALKKQWLSKAARVARENLTPDFPWSSILQGQDVFGAATGRWVLALTVFLTLAAAIFSRREFSYGQD